MEKMIYSTLPYTTTYPKEDNKRNPEESLLISVLGKTQHFSPHTVFKCSTDMSS